MAFFTWQDDFSVHVESMDEQHKTFFAYLNRLYDALQSGAEENAFKDIALALGDYIKTHIAEEETMLQSIEYPGLEAQQKQHTYFISEISSLKANLNSHSKTAVYTLQFMKEWFLNHILSEDKKYEEYLQQIHAGAS